MALPTTLTGADTPGIAAYSPPFKSSGGKFYVFARNASNTSNYRAWKADSDDPTSGWTAQDTANEASAGGLISSAWCHQVSDTIHIVLTDNTNDDLQYVTFDMSTDSWGTLEEITTSTAAQAACSISVRSDGDIIVAYSDAPVGNMGTDYQRVSLAREEGGGWTTGIALGAGTSKNETHEYGPVIQIGDTTNDRMHILWHEDGTAESPSTGHQLRLSTYLSNNTFGTSDEQVDSAVESSNRFIVGKGVSFDDGGTTKVRFPYVDGDGQTSVAAFDDADNPTPSTVTAAGDNGVLFLPSGFPLHNLANDGNTQHLLYINSADDDVYHDSTGAGDDTWGTDTNEETLGTDTTFISAAIYDR